MVSVLAHKEFCGGRSTIPKFDNCDLKRNVQATHNKGGKKTKMEGLELPHSGMPKERKVEGPLGSHVSLTSHDTTPHLSTLGFFCKTRIILTVYSCSGQE